MTTTTSSVSTARLRELIASELNELVEIRHDLHAHPELGYEEQRTSEVVQRELGSAGVEFAGGLAGGTGVLGHLPGTAAEAVGLRADMDALPIEEQSDLPYKSTLPGRMHACGHDGHTTMLIGTARVLSRLASEMDGGLPRPVTFVFQPAEEGGAGARRMVEDGGLNGSVLGPRVSHMFGQHGWSQLPLGVVGTRPGPFLAAADEFSLTVTGHGGHAAFPHHTSDPVAAGAAIVSALQTIASRNVDPLDSIVVSVTEFHAGTAHNIIPDAVELGGTVRTLLPQTQELAMERLDHIAHHVAQAHRCEARVDYRIGYPVTLNSDEAVEIFNEQARGSLGAERVVNVAQPFMGGEDFAFYCHEIPSCFFILGLLPAGQERMPSLHEPTFDFTDDAISTGVEMFCRLALRA